MGILSRLLGLGLLGLLLALLTMACESTKSTSSSELGNPTRLKGEAIGAEKTYQIVHITDTTMEFKTPRSVLAQAFIRQFNDGTVVDKVQVRKAPVGPNDPVTYYLIGLGRRNGMFRAMAIPLTAGGENTFYVTPATERYTLTSLGCTVCFFNFENGHILGTTCSENSGGGNCDLVVSPDNSLLLYQ